MLSLHLKFEAWFVVDEFGLRFETPAGLRQIADLTVQWPIRHARPDSAWPFAQLTLNFRENKASLHRFTFQRTSRDRIRNRQGTGVASAKSVKNSSARPHQETC